MKSYVLGFFFSGRDFYGSSVALICKKRPKWQEGKLNGIGGLIEEGEIPETAMRREFVQETGHDHDEWKRFALLHAKGNAVHCFVGLATEEPIVIKSPTDEEASWVHVSRVIESQLSMSFKDQFIYNLGWLVSMAFDHLNTGNFYRVMENPSVRETVCAISPFFPPRTRCGKYIYGDMRGLIAEVKQTQPPVAGTWDLVTCPKCLALKE